MREEIEIREIHEGDAEAFLDLLTIVEAETDFMLLEAGERATTVTEQRERIKGLLSTEVCFRPSPAGRSALGSSQHWNSGGDATALSV